MSNPSSKKEGCRPERKTFRSPGFINEKVLHDIPEGRRAKNWGGIVVYRAWCDAICLPTTTTIPDNATNCGACEAMSEEILGTTP